MMGNKGAEKFWKDVRMPDNWEDASNFVIYRVGELVFEEIFC